jgi:aldose 1-epimerase
MAEVRTAPRDLRIVELASPDGQLVARFAAGAGMVGCSLRHRGEELLGILRGLEAYVEDRRLFGIPLLHPWANRLAEWSYDAGGREVELDPSSPLLRADRSPYRLPIHGALTASPYWVVEDSGRDPDGAHLDAVLDYGAHDDLLAVFPFPHRLELHIRVRDGELAVDTTLRAGETAVPMSFGWHPYLAPPGTPRAKWVVEMPERTLMLLDERGLPTGDVRACAAERAQLGTRTFDDLFRVTGRPAQFAVTAGGRRIALEYGVGYPYAQVFAPAEYDVICFEPMTAPGNALRTHDGLRLVPPGQSARAAFAVRVEDA